jgi:hypothetical protein
MLIPLLLGYGCGSSGMEAPTATGYARVALSLSSTSQMRVNGPGNVGDLSEVMVDVDRVTAHAAGGWVTVSEEPVTVDILRLGEFATPLGFQDLPAGKITQIRLHVLIDSAPYVTLAADGSQVPLKVPSGMQSGIKLKGPWDLEACTLTNIELDLDRKKSIHVHPTGHEDLWILRPVIRAGGSSTDVGCDDDMTPPGEDTGEEPGDDPNDPGDQPPLDGDGDGIPDSIDPDAGTGPDGAGDGDDDNDGLPDTIDPDPTAPGDGYEPNDPGDGPLDMPSGGTDDPNAPSCSVSADCSATEFCTELGNCRPMT